MIYGVEYEYTTTAKRPPIQVPISSSLTLRARGPNRMSLRSPQKITLSKGKIYSKLVDQVRIPPVILFNKTKPQPKAVTSSHGQGVSLNISKIVAKKNLPISVGQAQTTVERKTTLMKPRIGQNISLVYPYKTKAVHFSGTQWLTRGAWLDGVGNVDKFIFSCWTKISNFNDGLWSIVPTGGNYLAQGATINSGVRYYSCNFADSYFDDVFNAPATSTVWQNVIITADISNNPAMLRTIVVNGIAQENSSDDGFGSGTFIVPGTDFFFGDDSFGARITGDVADVQFWLDQYLDFSLTQNLRLFYSAAGKPVDPAVAQATLGTPDILFKGDITSFPVNRGSGGPFTLHGSLTNATTSPTD